MTAAHIFALISWSLGGYTMRYELKYGDRMEKMRKVVIRLKQVLVN